MCNLIVRLSLISLIYISNCQIAFLLSASINRITSPTGSIRTRKSTISPITMNATWWTRTWTELQWSAIWSAWTTCRSTSNRSRKPTWTTATTSKVSEWNSMDAYRFSLRYPKPLSVIALYEISFLMKFFLTWSLNEIALLRNFS